MKKKIEEPTGLPIILWLSEYKDDKVEARLISIEHGYVWRKPGLIFKDSIASLLRDKKLGCKITVEYRNVVHTAIGKDYTHCINQLVKRFIRLENLLNER